MFEGLGSWLDWKRSEVSTAMSNVAFNHHVNKIQKKKNDNNKSFSNGSSATYKKVAEPAKEESKKSAEEKKPVDKKEETNVPEVNINEDLDKMVEDFERKTEGLDGVMDDELKDLIESVRRYQARKAAKAEKVNVPIEVDPAEKEHPEEDPLGVIDLKSLDSKKIPDVLYQVCYDNAEELLKYTVNDNENLSKEESDKRNKEFDEILLSLLAKALTGLDDVSGIDMERLEKDLYEKIGEGNVSGTIQTAFTTYVNDNTPEGKPLDLTKNSPMEIVEESAATAEPAPASNARRSNSRRKK